MARSTNALVPVKSESRQIQPRHVRTYESGKRVLINPRKVAKRPVLQPRKFRSPMKTQPKSALVQMKPRKFISPALDKPITKESFLKILLSNEQFSEYFEYVNNNRQELLDSMWGYWEHRAKGLKLKTEEELNEAVNEFIEANDDSSIEDWQGGKDKVRFTYFGDWSQLKDPFYKEFIAAQPDDVFEASYFRNTEPEPITLGEAVWGGLAINPNHWQELDRDEEAYYMDEYEDEEESRLFKKHSHLHPLMEALKAEKIPFLVANATSADRPITIIVVPNEVANLARKVMKKAKNRQI